MLQSSSALYKHANMKYKPYSFKQLKKFNSGLGARRLASRVLSQFIKVYDLR